MFREMRGTTSEEDQRDLGDVSGMDIRTGQGQLDM
jgi:hypothetical protein